MEILTRRELTIRKTEILEKIKNGAVFIFPTDTIYGLACNAQDEKAVARLREIKQRPESPFSVWTPSIEWIKENCYFSEENWNEHLNKLPGPYTFVLKLKNKDAVADNVRPGKADVGIRLPDHELSKFVEELGIPIVTTSANKHGDHFMTELENLDPEIERKVDFMVYEGEKKARPSRIVNLVTDEVIDR